MDAVHAVEGEDGAVEGTVPESEIPGVHFYERGPPPSCAGRPKEGIGEIDGGHPIAHPRQCTARPPRSAAEIEQTGGRRWKIPQDNFRLDGVKLLLARVNRDCLWMLIRADVS